MPRRHPQASYRAVGGSPRGSRRSFRWSGIEPWQRGKRVESKSNALLAWPTLSGGEDQVGIGQRLKDLPAGIRRLRLGEGLKRSSQTPAGHSDRSLFGKHHRQLISGEDFLQVGNALSAGREVCMEQRKAGPQ